MAPFSLHLFILMIRIQTYLNDNSFEIHIQFECSHFLTRNSQLYFILIRSIARNKSVRFKISANFIWIKILRKSWTESVYDCTQWIRLKHTQSWSECDSLESRKVCGEFLVIPIQNKLWCKASDTHSKPLHLHGLLHPLTIALLRLMLFS